MPSAGAERHNFKFNKERIMKKVKTNSQTQGLSIKNKILLAFSVILLLMVLFQQTLYSGLMKPKIKYPRS
jgi:methyl-accepting chemotaxis protein-2 (aspartate sensor receptor)